LPVASYYSESAYYWYHAKKDGVGSAHSTLCLRYAKWYLLMCNNNLAGWRHIKESLRPQFFFEKADMVEGLPGVQVQS
jgi:hypothetical protein